MPQNPYQAQFGATAQTVKGSGTDSQTRVSQNTSIRRVIKQLLSLCFLRKKWMSIVLFSTLCGVVFQALIPLYIAQIINSLFDVSAFSRAEKSLLLLLLLVVLFVLCNLVQGRYLARIGAYINRYLREKCVATIQDMSFTHLKRCETGDLVSIIVNDIDMLSDSFLQTASQLLSGFFTILLTLYFMFRLDALLTGIVVVCTPLIALVSYFLGSRSQKLFSVQQDIQGAITEYTYETIQASSLIELSNFTNQASNRYKSLNQELNSHGLQAQFISSLSNPATRFVNNITFGFIACMGFYVLASGSTQTLTLGGVQAFLTYAIQYSKPFNEISSTCTQLALGFASAQRIFNLLSNKEVQKVLSQMNSEKDSLDALTLKAEHVTFGYVPKKPVLHEISFTLYQNKKIALVGPTGCGKTTLLSLVMNFYQPQSGCFVLNDEQYRNINPDEFSNLFGLVVQEPWIMTGTIAENIAFGSSLSREEIMRIGSLCAVDRIVARFKDGYDALIEIENVQLSKGEIQLISIARLIAKNPRFILLDEATSSLDIETEHLVHKAFDELCKNKGSLIVAHRLSTIVNADEILVLKDGRIVERGTHRELLLKKGFYSDLYRDFSSN